MSPMKIVQWAFRPGTLEERSFWEERFAQARMNPLRMGILVKLLEI